MPSIRSMMSVPSHDGTIEGFLVSKKECFHAFLDRAIGTLGTWCKFSAAPDQAQELTVLNVPNFTSVNRAIRGKSEDNSRKEKPCNREAVRHSLYSMSAEIDTLWTSTSLLRGELIKKSRSSSIFRSRKAPVHEGNELRSKSLEKKNRLGRKSPDATEESVWIDI